ncbi:MAG: hypothetical protein WAZ12_04030 [Candidatus Absconditicoccaceae bacterium]
MTFHKTISQKDIQNFISNTKGEKSKVVKEIQNLKENTIDRLMQDFGQDDIKFIDPMLVKGVEKDYFEILKTTQGNVDPNFDYNIIKKDIENMFKRESFQKDYIKKYKSCSESKYLETSHKQLLQRKKELSSNIHIGHREQEELSSINGFLKLLETENIENTKSRNIMFDKDYFTNTGDKFNIQCFFEQDEEGNRNYFSINELLNDLETFGIESGYPKIQTETFGGIEGFNNVQKFIKLALLKNILAKYRNYQEVLMYNFIDYEKGEHSDGNRIGLLAEKVVERTFRNFADIDNRYSVKVRKSSIGEDEKNKVDLIIHLKDKKTGLNIEKELQLTIDHHQKVLEHKRLQIDRQKGSRGSNLDLLELELHLLDQKITLRRNLNRPIGGLNNFLSIEDKEFLKKTYDRIIGELEEKQ